jgi:hypothetical protein
VSAKALRSFSASAAQRRVIAPFALPEELPEEYRLGEQAF